MITYAERIDGSKLSDAGPAGSAEAREGDMYDHEIAFRRSRLLREAEQARLAAARPAAESARRRSGIRRLVGHALIDLGELLEGANPCPDERIGTARA